MPTVPPPGHEGTGVRVHKDAPCVHKVGEQIQQLRTTDWEEELEKHGNDAAKAGKALTETYRDWFDPAKVARLADKGVTSCTHRGRDMCWQSCHKLANFMELLLGLAITYLLARFSINLRYRMR